jgi:hypothetical protein
MLATMLRDVIPKVARAMWIREFGVLRLPIILERRSLLWLTISCLSPSAMNFEMASL